MNVSHRNPRAVPRPLTWILRWESLKIKFWLSVIISLVAGIFLSVGLTWIRGQMSDFDVDSPIKLSTNLINAKSLLPSTYGDMEIQDHVRVQPLVANTQSPDTTAIVLNWSRLQNVVDITALLCSTLLENIISEVFVWNNSPRKLTREIFANANCPARKLKIYNSPSNLRFQARYFACAESSSKYCFVQDDDYLVLPEIIQTLHASAEQIEKFTAIHLLPPHEVLSTFLHFVHTPTGIHTSSAWLGHGTIMRQTQAVEFISLMRWLNVSEEEMQMADNYFAVFANRAPNVWFDQGISLGGGQPFTVGVEGDERNKRHVSRAAQYLDLLKGTSSSLRDDTVDVPFIDTSYIAQQEDIARGPCAGNTCLLETTIGLLPPTLKHEARSAQDIIRLGEENLKALGQTRMLDFFNYPPAAAVDGRVDTAFRSPDSARAGDIVSLDMLSDLSTTWCDLWMAWLVDAATARLLLASVFQVSLYGDSWIDLPSQLSCITTNLTSADHSNVLECSLSVTASNPRFLRAKLQEDREETWCIYELWMRGIPKG